MNKDKRDAIALYKKGLSTRKVGQAIGKSHQWVAEVVRELSTSGILT